MRATKMAGRKGDSLWIRLLSCLQTIANYPNLAALFKELTCRGKSNMSLCVHWNAGGLNMA